MKNRGRGVKYLMLSISIIMMVLYILPHHHHHDGMACYSLTEEAENRGSHSNDSHTCNCTGHHLFFKANLLDENDSDTIPFYFLLAVIPDPFGQISPICLNLPYRQIKGIYAEMLQDVSTTCNGLRAPPFVFA